MKSIALALGLLLLSSLAHAQDALRYVVPSPRPAPLWQSLQSSRACGAKVLLEITSRRATPPGTYVDTFCAEYLVGGLESPTRVERLDAPCGDMVQVRVLDGPLQGKTGCVAAKSLTSIKPEGAK
jgi:hypothetical protein